MKIKEQVKQIGEYKLINKGYYNEVYKNGELVAEFTDTFIGAIATIKKGVLPND